MGPSFTLAVFPKNRVNPAYGAARLVVDRPHWSAVRAASRPELGRFRAIVITIMSFKALFVTMAILLSVGIAHAQGARPAPPAASGQIDINSASRDDLMSLDGIGEVRADAIIRARPFKAKTDLVERRLIPEALYEKIADKVMARPPPAAPPARPAQPTPKRT